MAKFEVRRGQGFCDRPPCQSEATGLPEGTEGDDGLSGTVVGPTHSGPLHAHLEDRLVARLDGATADGSATALRVRVGHPVAVGAEVAQHVPDLLPAGEAAREMPQRAEDTLEAILLLQDLAKPPEVLLRLLRAFAICCVEGVLQMNQRMEVVEQLQGARKGLLAPGPEVPFLLL